VGGRLLLAMTEHPALMTQEDLAAHADLPPSRAHPDRVSHGKLGLVQQDATSDRHALGPAALHIGLTCLLQLDAERGPAQAELQAHGVTRAVGRPIPGVNALSAPVRDHEGEAALVITLLGHQDQLPSARSSPMAAAARDAATQVSTNLGYREASPAPRGGARGAWHRRARQRRRAVPIAVDRHRRRRRIS